MAYRDPAAKYELRRDHWATGPNGEQSVWTFRRNLYKGDSTAINDAAFEIVRKTPVAKIVAAQRRGEDIDVDLDQKTRKDVALVRLAHMSVSWSGPEFEIPAGADHPNAGGLAEITPDNIDLLFTEEELETIEKELLRVWSGRTPAQQETFSPGPRSLVEAGTGRADRADAES